MEIIKPPKELLENLLEDDRVRYLPAKLPDNMPDKPIMEWTMSDFCGFGVEFPMGTVRIHPLKGVFEYIILGNLLPELEDFYQDDFIGIRGTVISLGDCFDFSGPNMIGDDDKRHLKSVVDVLDYGIEVDDYGGDTLVNMQGPSRDYIRPQLTLSMGRKLIGYTDALSDQPDKQAVIFPVVLVYNPDYVLPKSASAGELIQKEDMDKAISAIYICDKYVMEKKNEA